MDSIDALKCNGCKLESLLADLDRVHFRGTCYVNVWGSVQRGGV